MATDIDSLKVQITATAVRANNSIDKLVAKIDRLTESLSKVDGSRLNGLANSVEQLGRAMQTMNTVKTADFTRLGKNLTNLNNLDVSRFGILSDNLNKVAASLVGLTGISEGAKQLSEIANGIKQLGYKSADKAIQNIPLLATAMRQLMEELSKAPKVSQNLIDMTNALAKFARTGASGGRAANSLNNSLNGYSKAAKTAKTHTFSLASAIGKMYASYWLLFRAVGKIRNAIDVSSALTEVQNVVDVTFGEYASLVEKMSETSIADFGMSELTAKEVSSRFQAMGTAMGFTQGKMADMSIELTKLTADMASFYNVEQDAVAKSLQSIFTGETEPLRKYGLDLTNATLQEWALKSGIDANVKSMSQMGKTMLRYQYVMSNTGAAQGDFARTVDTWANQTRILKQNLESLASVVGGTLINALKPLVTALNIAMNHVIAFAETVSNALGKIFGWKYESGGGVATDLETGAGAVDDISSGMSDAAKSAKKLKDYTLGIDELNVINPDTSNGSGGSGGGGELGETGAYGAAGKWVKETEMLDYESALSNLYALGVHIGVEMQKALDSIPWDSVYEKARNFGTGLADFLNGLISPALFGKVGKTIANSLDAAIYTVLSFGETFSFYDFGVSIATGINEFFKNFDFSSLAETINTFVGGLEETIRSFLNAIKWRDILNGIGEFLGTLEIDTVEILIGAFVIKNTASNVAALLLGALAGKINVPILVPQLLISIRKFSLANINLPAFQVIGNQIIDKIDEFIKNNFGERAVDAIGNSLLIFVGSGIGGVLGGPAGALAGALITSVVDAVINSDFGKVWGEFCNKIFDFSFTNRILEKSKLLFSDAFKTDNFIVFGKNIVAGITTGFLGAFTFFSEPIANLFDFVVKKICDLFGIHSPAKEMEPLGKNILLGIVEGFFGAIGEFTSKANDFLENHVKPLFSGEVWGEAASGILEGIKGKWGETTTWFFDNVVTPLSGKFSELNENISNSFVNASNEARVTWSPVSEWFNENVTISLVTNFSTMKTKVHQLFALLWQAIQATWKTVSGWFNNTVITPVENLFIAFETNISNIFTALWSAIQTVWATASEWFNNTVIVPVQTGFEEATGSIGDAFDGLWKGIKSGVINAMNTAISAVEEAVNWIIGSVNDVIDSINSIGDSIGDAIGVSVPSIPTIPRVRLGRIPAYELGGFPEDGLFFANHTELVGQFSNGKNAVANNEQIIAGIKQGVYEANSEQDGLIREMIGLLQDIRAKDTTIKMSGREVGKGLDASSRRQGYKLRASY